MAEAYTQAYVFGVNPDGNYINAGVITIDHELGSFTYSKEWLDSPWAYPLDPVNLPLSARRFTTDNPKAVFGVFTDAGPDDWGTRIMLMQHRGIPKNEIERLLRTSGNGVGVLRFSLSRARIKEPARLSSLNCIDSLEQTAKKLLEKHTLTKDEFALIEPGSSMGGARPKVSVTDNQGRTWLAKLATSRDFFNVPLVEYSTMKLLKAFGLNVPDLQLIALGDDTHALLIERFDKFPARPVHFISANSLFNIPRIRTVRDSKLNPYSYINLARILRKYAHNPKHDTEELFKRMVANILLGNTDDHARNHAMVFDIKSATWGLSPLYDVLPIVESTLAQQSLGVGKFGRDSTLENALSYCNLFGLDETQAKAIVERLRSTIRHWRQTFEADGVEAMDIDLLAKIIDERLKMEL